MSHVIDLTKPLIKQAITELGINSDHLLYKTLDDFQDAEIESHISKLRYDFYTRKQKEFIRLITEKLKTYTQKFQKSSNIKTPVFLTQVSTPSAPPESRLKDIHRLKFFKNLDEIYKNEETSKEIDKKIEHSREVRQKYLSVKNVRKLMMEKFRERQAENFEKLRKNQPTSWIKKRFENLTPKIRTNNSIEFFNKEDSVSEYELDVDQRIKYIENKMKKSELIHNSYLKQKKDNIQKMLEKETKRLRPKENHSDSEKLLKFIEKQKALKERHKSLENNKKMNLKIFSQKLQNRLNEAQKKTKKLQDSTLKEQKIQFKMAKAELSLKKIHEQWQKKIDLKNEVSRIKEENIQSELERYSTIQ